MGQLNQKVALITGADITGSTYIIDDGFSANTGGL